MFSRENRNIDKRKTTFKPKISYNLKLAINVGHANILHQSGPILYQFLKLLFYNKEAEVKIDVS